MWFDSWQGQKYFPLHHRVQTDPVVHQISYRVAGALSPGEEQLGRKADHSLQSSAEFKECAGLYLHSTSTSSWCGA